jgi:hypothetical protein
MARGSLKLTGYDRGVFINCPFDRAYRPLLEALVFTVLACGFVPRSALEIDDSNQIRLEKIAALIGGCRLGVHDISRTDTSSPGGLPRFNVPLELGGFLFVQRLGLPAQRRKRALILDSEPSRYRNFISDIAGQDIKAHDNEPARVIAAVRDFLSGTGESILPGGRTLQRRFADFAAKCRRSARTLAWTPMRRHLQNIDGLFSTGLR